MNVCTGYYNIINPFIHVCCFLIRGVRQTLIARSAVLSYSLRSYFPIHQLRSESDGIMTTTRDYESVIREAGEWGAWQWRMVVVMMTPAMVASISTLSWVFTARSGGNHSSILSDLDIVGDKIWIKSFLAPVFMLGMLVGAPIIGYLSDQHGRRPSLLLSLTLVTVSGALLPALPHSLPWHACLRLMSGCGAGGTLVTTFVYLVEWPTADSAASCSMLRSWRLVSALALHIGWNIGQALLVMSSLFIYDWRHFIWTSQVVSVIAIISVIFMPESARWLTCHNKLEQARIIIERIAAVNKREVSQDTLKELSPPNNAQETPTFAGLHLRLSILCFLWFAANICYYGIHYSASQLHGNLQINFSLLMLAEVAANMFAHLVALSYFGRRKTLILCLTLSSVVLILNTSIPHSLINVRICLTIIGKFAATTNFNSIYFYTCELFPTCLRSRSIGVCSTVGRLGAMISVGCVQLDWVSEYLPSLIMSTPAVMAALLLFKIQQPETKNCSLPDNTQPEPPHL